MLIRARKSTKPSIIGNLQHKVCPLRDGANFMRKHQFITNQRQEFSNSTNRKDCWPGSWLISLTKLSSQSPTRDAKQIQKGNIFTKWDQVMFVIPMGYLARWVKDHQRIIIAPSIITLCAQNNRRPLCRSHNLRQQVVSFIQRNRDRGFRPDGQIRRRVLSGKP